MLACQCKDIKQIQYPVLATPKIDGIRCITRNRDIYDPRLGSHQVAGYSRSLKLIPNKFIQNYLALEVDLSGLDGELVVGKNFQESTSGIMSSEGEPDFTFYVFDHVNENDPMEPYFERVQRLLQLKELGIGVKIPRIQVLAPHLIENESYLHLYEEAMLKKGHEGIMLRTLSSPYKFGRSTWREQYLVKIKRFKDAEARIIDFVEKMHNLNEQTISEVGLAERSSHKENLVPAGVLGALRVRDDSGKVFNIGTGFDDAQRKEIWENRDSWIGKIAKFKYQPFGTKDAPRCPVFLGVRDQRDGEFGQGSGQIDLGI